MRYSFGSAPARRRAASSRACDTLLMAGSMSWRVQTNKYTRAYIAFLKPVEGSIIAAATLRPKHARDCIMLIFPALSWRLAAEAGDPIDPRLMPLLEAIAAHGTLARAAVACDISYRAAWGLLRQYELLFGAPLVALERGRGARLAAVGEKIV